MTISHIQGASENSGASASFSRAVGAGDVVCVVFGYGAGTLASITDDQGNSYTIVGSSSIGGGTVGLAYLANIANGPRTITMNGSGFTFPSLIIDEFSGAGAYDADKYTTTTTNSSTLPSGNITTAQNGELLYAASWAVNSGSVSIGSPWTMLENNVYGNVISAWQVQATAGLVGASFTPSSGNDTGFAAILAFKPGGTAVTGDGFVATGWNVTALADPVTPAEWLRRASGAAGEIFESVVRAQPSDTCTAYEALSVQHEDSVLWVEALSAAAANAVLALEWQGRLAVIAEASWPLAIAGRLLRDLTSLLEANAGAAVALAADSNLTLGVLAGAALGPALPSEAIGQAITFLEAFLAIEASSQLGADAALAGESLRSALAGAIAVTELWATAPSRVGPGRLLASPGKRRFLTGWILEQAED